MKVDGMEQKYVVIISEETDFSTNGVIDWLRNMNVPVIRVNDTDFVRINSLSINENVEFDLVVHQTASGKSFQLTSNNILSVWYRRGRLNFHEHLGSKVGLPDIYCEEIHYEHQYQARNVRAFFNLLFKYDATFKIVGSELDNSTNKLFNLTEASKVGLKVPSSLLTTDKKELVDFNSKLKNGIITKPISQGPAMGKKARIFGYTTLITNDILEEIPDKFPFSFFQENVEKTFEVRTFYINGKTYSIAIFSQGDEKTKVDFRNYNEDKPNRTPPYNLPLEIEQKVIHLMNKLGMESGSLDFLVDNNGEHIFLEVNPVGQYYQVSYPSNYKLDYVIAKELVTHEE